MREPYSGLDEIERAIAAVRAAQQGWFAGALAAPVGPISGSGAVTPRVQSSGASCSWPCLGRGGISRVDLSILVPVRGHVPLAFFAWLKSVKERAALECRMLELCSFECPDGQADAADAVPMRR